MLQAYADPRGRVGRRNHSGPTAMDVEAGTVVRGLVWETRSGRTPLARCAAGGAQHDTARLVGKAIPRRHGRMSPWGASWIASTPAARCGCGPPGPFVPPPAWPWRDAQCIWLPPPAGGARSRVPSRRPSRARGPLARARRHGRTARRVGGPPAAWIGLGRAGASPRRAMPPPRAARRRWARRSPSAGRPLGWRRARLSTGRPRPWCRRPSARRARPPGAAPVAPPPTGQVGGLGQRPWPAPSGQRSAWGPRPHRPRTVRGPARPWPSAAAPERGQVLFFL